MSRHATRSICVESPVPPQEVRATMKGRGDVDAPGRLLSPKSLSLYTYTMGLPKRARSGCFWSSIGRLVPLLCCNCRGTLTSWHHPPALADRGTHRGNLIETSPVSVAQHYLTVASAAESPGPSPRPGRRVAAAADSDSCASLRASQLIATGADGHARRRPAASAAAKPPPATESPARPRAVGRCDGRVGWLANAPAAVLSKRRRHGRRHDRQGR